MLIQTVTENLYRILIVLLSLNAINIFYTSQVNVYNTVGTVKISYVLLCYFWLLNGSPAGWKHVLDILKTVGV
jgi:hypothetical protein